MIDISKGRYWDEGIQLVDGCTPCSPGCRGCWSANNSYRFSKSQTIKIDNNPPQFTGLIEVHPDRLKRFNTRKPKVFAIWNDLFHEEVPHGLRHDTYAWAALFPQNTYLILTKREKVMLRYLSMRQSKGDADICRSINKIPNGIGDRRGCLEFPLFNVWHGLTVCNQQEADEKIPIFLQVPGKKFLSIEPMLGAIDLKLNCIQCNNYVDAACSSNKNSYCISKPKLDAVILGGETGHGARPLHPDLVRSVRDQCAAAGVPFFFKSFGTYKGVDDWKIPPGRELDGRFHDDLPWKERA